MKRSLAWLPAVIAPIVVVAGVVAVPSWAGAATAPAPKSAAQVLELIANSAHAHYSGTIQESSDLGLPQLPSSMASSMTAGSSGVDLTSILEVVTGPNTAKVYVDGQSKLRVQLLDQLSERDLVRNGSTVWIYSSKADTAAKLTLPSRMSAEPTPAKTGMPTTPAAVAGRIVALASHSSSVTTRTGTDLGRGVYELTLRPKASGSLVADAVLTVDAATGVPLAARIDAVGQSTPALQLAFSSIDFGTPAASVFDFTPPTGSTVTSMSDSTKTGAAKSSVTTPDAAKRGSAAKPKLIGSGWTTIVELPAGRLTAASAMRGTDAGPAAPSDSATSGTAKLSWSRSSATAGGDQADALLSELTTKVAGGRVLATSVFTVYLRSDGAVFAGAVSESALLAAAK